MFGIGVIAPSVAGSGIGIVVVSVRVVSVMCLVFDMVSATAS